MIFEEGEKVYSIWAKDSRIQLCNSLYLLYTLTLWLIYINLKINYMEDVMDRDARNILAAFLLGGVIGAAVALLYAPKSGRETREDISRAAGKIKKGTIDLADDIIESVHDFAEDVKDKATDVINRGKELSESARKEIIKTLEHGQKAIEKQRKRIIDAIGL